MKTNDNPLKSLKTTEVGAIVSAVDIGSLSVVVLVAWLGGKGNRAWWVGGGAMLVSIGSALFTLPQWIGDKYVPSGTDVNDLGMFFNRPYDSKKSIYFQVKNKPFKPTVNGKKYVSSLYSRFLALMYAVYNMI